MVPASVVRQLEVKLIDSHSASTFVKRFHYSKKVVANSKIHFGVLHEGRLKGVMSFGCPMDKKRALGLVRGTSWGGMLELNRMAFAPELPKNSESRCLGYALRFIRREYPQIKWIQTFADACQCGDGAIYRAVGFLLVGIKRNTSLRLLKTGEIIAKKTLDDHRVGGRYLSSIIESRPLPGFQIKYIYFLDPSKRKDLTVNALDYSAIEKYGAKMYKGIRAGIVTTACSEILQEGGGSIPTSALQTLK